MRKTARQQLMHLAVGGSAGPQHDISWAQQCCYTDVGEDALGLGNKLLLKKQGAAAALLSRRWSGEKVFLCEFSCNARPFFGGGACPKGNGRRKEAARKKACYKKKREKYMYVPHF